MSRRSGRDQLGFDFAPKPAPPPVPAIEVLAQRGYLAELDYHFARTVCRLAGETDPMVRLAAAVASRQVRHGHVCADLSRLVEAPFIGEDGEPLDGLHWPELGLWKACLRSSKLVTAQPAPLVLEEPGRLYLLRYYRYQSQLAGALLSRATAITDDIDEAQLADGLQRLFTAGGPEPDWQRVAAEHAVRRDLSVICGGPGTGKTSTVVRFLALLHEQAMATGTRAPHVTLVAPTGKAAARLSESIIGALGELDCSAEIKAAITTKASTIHRGLGRNFDHPSRFRSDANNPLPADVVVVDEASMIDLAMMAKLVDAVRPDAKLILLGDENQLASVEAGAILGDITNAGAAADDGPAAACITRLVRSYRFDDNSGVGAVAAAIRAGDGERAVELLTSGTGDASLITVHRDAEIAEAVAPLMLDGLAPYFDAAGPEARLAELWRFRILCAHRRGVAGVEALNRFVTERLTARDRIQPRGEWFDGRPLMVLENDYQLDLFNGDVGVVGKTQEGLRVFFRGAQGQVRAFAPGRLAARESVFAMTVHKSQGSEFEEVVVVLPDQLSPILSRELLYTAVTRARKRVRIIARPEVIVEAVQRRIQRASGLRAALWP